jgi:hypothetical protein
MNETVNQSEIHVLVHIRLFEEIAGDTGAKEEVRLDVNVVTFVGFVLCNAGEEFCILLLELREG